MKPGDGRGSLRLLVDPVFGPFFAAKVGSSLGVWIANVVAAVVVYQMTRSAFLVGAVSIAQFVPQIVLAPLAGALADRGSRVRLLIAGRLVSSAAAGVLAVWIGLVGQEGLPGAWPVILAALFTGIGFAISVPASHALVPALVRPEELPSAVALDALPFTIARAAGPAIGAVLLAVAGPTPAFAAAAAGHLVFAMVIGYLRPQPAPRSEEGDRSVRAGLRHLRVDPGVAVLLAGVTTVGLGVDPVITLTPPLAEQLGGGEALVGLLASAFGIGAMLSIVFLGSVRRRAGLGPLGPAGLALLAVGMGGLAVSPGAVGAVAAMTVGGVGMMLAITGMTTQLQQRLPEELRGRVMALWSVCFVGSRPLAAAVNGAIADATSVQVALTVTTVTLVGGAALLLRQRTRHLRIPAADPPDRR